jgi:hypothetical protein
MTDVQDAAHPNTCPFIEVSTRKHNRRIFTAEFQGYRRQMLRCGHSNLQRGDSHAKRNKIVAVATYLASNLFGSDKCYVFDIGGLC